MRILTIVGARPQFIKAAMVSRAIARRRDVDEFILHTGQHYDPNMSEVFFMQMGIPKPNYQLDCGGGTHGEMTGRMLIEIERALVDCNPDLVLLYGDTNSTLAGALASAKLHIPVAHVEAGVRTFNRMLPEEINRICTDHVADLLFTPTESANVQLAKEGITRGVHHVGDVMYDAALAFGKVAEEQSGVLGDLCIEPGKYLLATCHRTENTDDPKRLESIFSALDVLAVKDRPVIIPLHPRTVKCLKSYGLDRFLEPNRNLSLKVIPPCGFLDMVLLERKCQVLLTDSGGVQKEAYFHGVPCVTFRDESAWMETIDAGWNVLVGANKERIISAVRESLSQSSISCRRIIPDYGDGHACEKIVGLIATHFELGESNAE